MKKHNLTNVPASVHHRMLNLTLRLWVEAIEEDRRRPGAGD